MATVVLAEDTVLGRQVALKRMITTGDAEGLLRLRREALVGASISHPNLVAVFDVITLEEGEHVIVMEYVRGETLRDALEREGRLAPRAALPILEGVAAGLDAIHGQGIVHRDVKPANVLLGIDGRVKLADLGIASVPDRTEITTSGAVLGSFRYMAPEQLEDAPAMPAIDIYGLSAVAFELLSGRQARPEPNPIALAYAISSQPPPDLREAWPEAPRAAAALLKRGMAHDPSQRPRSAGELTRQLRATLEPPAPRRASAAPLPPRRVAPVAPRVEPVERRRARPRLLAGLLALAVATIVLVAAALSSGGSSPAGRRAAAGGRASSTASGSHRSTRSTPAAAAQPSARSTTAPASSTTPSTSAAAPATGATGHPSTPAAGANTGAPISAVESFYELAAAHRYAEAWALADPSFRAQLGGYGSFQAGQSGDRAIRFNAARIASQSGDAATVAINTTSVRTDGTHQCSGTVDLRRAGAAGGWLLHLIHINCT
jgi:serine/threonine-protein kinase